MSDGFIRRGEFFIIVCAVKCYDDPLTMRKEVGCVFCLDLSLSVADLRCFFPFSTFLLLLLFALATYLLGQSECLSRSIIHRSGWVQRVLRLKEVNHMPGFLVVCDANTAVHLLGITFIKPSNSQRFEGYQV